MVTIAPDPRSGPSPAAVDALPATLCHAFQRTLDRCPDRPALRREDGSVVWTWREYGARVAAVAAGLHGLGLRRGDRIALMLANGPAFHAVDAAALHVGATPFSVYATSSPEQIAFALGHAGASIVVCSPEHADAVRRSGAALDRLLVVADEREGLQAIADHGDPGWSFDDAWRAASPDDLATLVYTSGTTGPPKAVQISHANVLACARAVGSVVGFPDGAEILSYLPLAHVAERNNSHWFAFCFGFTVTSCPSPGRVLDVLPSARPTWFFGVPRIFEKLRAGLQSDADAAVVADLATVLGTTASGDERTAAEDRLRARIGLDRAVAVNVGAAPVVPELIGFFRALGVPLAELWGMTELCGSGTINPRDAAKIGTVGPAVPGVELRLAADGEVEVRGALLTPGYFGRPDLTAEAMTADGWLKTGDVGVIDEDGYLSIVDRKKELIINAGGKNMSPTAIEAQIKGASLLVGQAIAIGDRRAYNVALLVLDGDGARAFAREHDLGTDDLEALVEHPAVVAEVDAAVARANARLSRVEQIKRYRLLPREWPADGDELTATMKLRRRAIHDKYATLIEELYG